MIQYDEFGIPVSASLKDMPFSNLTENDKRLEPILGRKLTKTEKAAATTMESEHASYGSSRFHLKTLLPHSGPNHFRAIGDEAASVAFFVNYKKETVVASYSSESHNWPSYVCAHPGAATGVGGDERDKIVNDGSKVSASYEARRQGHPEFNSHSDPIKQHTDETTQGIADYANAMGIPHGDGSIKYHPGFAGNNLVNVMGISISKKERLMRNKVPFGNAEDYVAIYVGKASDATGLGGVIGASHAIDMSKTDLNEKAVQDPDPHLQEICTRGIELVVDRAIKDGWKHLISMKDMGGAGLLCSTVEQMHDKFGIVINGDLVPQNQERDSETLLNSETQERFMIIVHKDHSQEVLDIFNKEIGLPYINMGASAKIVGRCNNTGRYVFVRNGIIDVDVPASDLASGPILYRHLKEPSVRGKKMPDYVALPSAIDKIFDSINFKSDAYIHDHYDKHVRSTNIVNRGEGCATLRTHPLFKGKVAYSVSFDSNPIVGILDPKLQAEDSFVRGAYRMATVGCSVIGVTNNANYGRTDVPEEMWEFVQGQQGVAKACYNWELEPEYMEMILQDDEIAEKFNLDKRRNVTVNSGNCSLNKANANTNTAIPPTTILGLVGWTNCPKNYATWNMSDKDSKLFLVGARQNALGATDYLQTSFGPDCLGDRPFSIDYDTCRKEVAAIIKAVRKGYIASANLIEEGGLCNAVGELFANTRRPVKVSVHLYKEIGPRNLDIHQKLFSESHGVVLQVEEKYVESFLDLCKANQITSYEIGITSKAKSGNEILKFYSDESLEYTQSLIRDLYNNKLERKLNYLGTSHGLVQDHLEYAKACSRSNLPIGILGRSDVLQKNIHGRPDEVTL